MAEIEYVNLDVMARNGVVVDNEAKIREIYDMYNKKAKKCNISKFVWIVMLILLFITPSNILEEGILSNFELGFLLITVVLFVLSITFYFNNKDIIKINKKIRVAKNNGETLMCYESRIIELYHVTPGGSIGRYRKELCYLRLDGYVRLPIEFNRYNEMKKNNINRVKVYFYKELLNDHVYYVENVL